MLLALYQGAVRRFGLGL